MTSGPKKHALFAAILMLTPAAALAQDQAAIDKQANKVAEKAQDLKNATAKLDNTIVNTSQNSAAATSSNDGDNDGRRRDHHEDHGKWGLLGLLGLAGLLGLKRRDHDHRDRRDYEDRTASSTRTAPGTGPRL